MGAVLLSGVAIGCGTESGGTTAEGGASGAGETGTGGVTATGGATETGGVTGTGGTGGRAGGGGAAGPAGAGGGAAGAGAAGKAGAGGAAGAAALSNTTIWIAGDSTVMTYPEPNTDGDNMISLYGWGQEIGQFFNSKVTINNQAIGGRSVAFFMWSVVTDSSGAYQCVDDQGTPEFQMTNGNKVNTSQWSRILNGMKAGDFLLIQFGTNDETHTCPRYVSLADFETDFGIMADAARAKGATPIFVTPMGHRTFSGTTATNTLLPYANAMKSEATQKTVEVEDLNLESEAYYTSVGNSFLATNLFDGGTTHFIEAGAVEMAKLIVAEVRKNNGALAGYLE
jgi:lysophospholipase L1-like esterase